MILHPAVIALVSGSLIISAMVLSTTYSAIRILRHWDLRSGSDVQLTLERQTYLISTIMSYAFCFQLFSLFLFIFTADKLSSLFVGAMCAAGTLNVNGFGYPVLLFKIATFILGGVWLIINYTDNRAVDYPLIKAKYRFLLVIAPFVFTEAILQAGYFLHLNAHVITSCCGSLFSPESTGVSATVTSLPDIPMKILFYGAVTLTCLWGGIFSLRGRPLSGMLFSSMSLITFVVSVAALISFISLYVYELPTHHCPFCILQGEYGYVGYPLYATLLAGVVAGVGTGVLMPARKIPSLMTILPAIQRRLTLVTIICYLLFVAISTWKIVTSSLTLRSVALLPLIFVLASPLHARDFVVKRNVEGYTMEVTINQNPPIVGKNDLRVELKDSAGKHVVNAPVAVNYFMPPMPNMPPMNYTVKASSRGSGYGATMDLIMQGPWNIVVRAGVGGKQIRMTVLIDVR